MYTETGTFHVGHIQVLLEQGSRSPRGGTWTLMAGVRRQITNHPGGARAVGRHLDGDCVVPVLNIVWANNQV